MTRQKVRLAFIQNDTARKATFKKRKRGLLKKAHELATLCDVPVGVIVNNPLEPSPPEIWPSREAMHKIVYDLQKMSVIDQTKKMVNHESYLKQRINKSADAWKKLYKENKGIEVKEVMFNCLKGKTRVSDHVEKRNLGDLRCLIDQYLKDVNLRYEILKNNDDGSSSSLAVSAPAPATTSHVEMASSAAFYNKIRGEIENSLKKNQIHKDLDLNQAQW